ncbi:NAD+ synthase [bacterium]|nr:NAD+ synthase [bacterium]
MKVTLAQLNPVIGDFPGNIRKMETALDAAAGDDADLVIFSELFPSGYPPKDWLTKKGFLLDYERAGETIRGLTRKYPKQAVLYGSIDVPRIKEGKGLYNAAVLLQNGTLLYTQRKTLLPTYDVFDEARYFNPAAETDIYRMGDTALGITICEDIWNDPSLFPFRPYGVDPVTLMAEKGAGIIINISASPFAIGKEEIRYTILRNHAAKHRLPVILVNQVGANDELISDGRSMIVDGTGALRVCFPAFTEHIETVDLSHLPAPFPFIPLPDAESVTRALVLGIRDYAEKNRFGKAVLGLSGGIDSALTCCLAAKALGPENVHAVYMPSPYSSQESGEDAAALAAGLGVHYQVIDIGDLFSAYKKTLGPVFANMPEDVTEENLQARIRGNIIMALSNKFGYLALSSGNKSELAVGYCTLYGDMSGGLSVLGDVYKTMVYRLCRYINESSPVIPERIFTKAPSAELKPGQKDQDTLPPYEILDSVLRMYIEEKCATDEIIAGGYEPGIVAWIINAVKKNEYKRIQAAPVLKISATAFGSGRRIPIAADWKQLIQ